MRAAPAARGTGVGRTILHHIIAEARNREYARLGLETGTAALRAPAISLYRSAGFISCGPFADHRESPHNQFMRLDLSHWVAPAWPAIQSHLISEVPRDRVPFR
jgi:putative acetyltransferase